MGRGTKKSVKKKVKKLKALIFAHEICPFSGSECSVGWNTITSIAKYHNITVIHAETNQSYSISYKKNIKKYLEDFGTIENVEFISVSQPKINMFFSKINTFSNNYGIGFPFIYQLIYRLWQKKCYKVAKKLLKKNKFNIVHQLTSVHIINPGFAHKLKLPFVWGPTGGLIKLNQLFIKGLDFKTRFRETVRNIYIDFVRLFSINLRLAIKRAKLMYLFSNEDLQVVRPLTSANLKLQIDTGTVTNSLNRNLEPKKEITAIWVGSISPRKCPKILLKSLIKIDFDNLKFTLIFVYSGTLTKEIQLLLEILMQKINVDIKNNIGNKEVQNLMASSSFLIHTSFREAASAVILEAISNGLPIICHDVSGMALAVDNKSGIKIPLISYNSSIRLFSDAIIKLSKNKELLKEMHYASFERSNELTWKKKGKLIAIDYIKLNEKYSSK